MYCSSPTTFTPQRPDLVGQEHMPSGNTINDISSWGQGGGFCMAQFPAGPQTWMESEYGGTSHTINVHCCYKALSVLMRRPTSTYGLKYLVINNRLKGLT